ncbi:phage shock envelope stress response protein PspM [Actinophytocola sp.]|uniref:phage shock envelope stress response protein PspM n=1 Tax=Actinophytocola sp. TaxID=1872138 RepID=UPI002D7E3CFA|nr:hypothetical protein [Actinophytocola sp.]HET9138087.1 hypothetical protein [Actinophytocola sp.]
MWTCFWGSTTLVGLLIVVAYFAGLDPTLDGKTALGGAIFIIFGGGMTVLGMVGLRASGRSRGASDLPNSPARLSRRVVKPRQLPRPGSVARDPMRRLADAEGALTEVLHQLHDLGAGSEVLDDWIDAAREAAANAATELRATAVRLEAVELAARHAATADRESLKTGVRDLRQTLDGGVEAYGALISAACRVLLADTPSTSRADLTDATDRLAALATALRELRSPD